jgi:hypothetical protein
VAPGLAHLRRLSPRSRSGEIGDADGDRVLEQRDERRGHPRVLSCQVPALVAGTVMRAPTAREGGGAVFDVIDSGYGAPTFGDSHLLGDTSGKFQTAPGYISVMAGSYARR